MDELKAKLKETRHNLEETKKDRNKKIDLINAEKKKYNKLKYDYDGAKLQIANFDK